MKRITSIFLVVIFIHCALAASDFDFDFSENQESSKIFPKPEIGGEVKLDLRAYIENEEKNIFKNKADILPKAALDFQLENDYVKMGIDLNLSRKSIEDYNEDIVNTAYAQVFLTDFILEAGKKKIVWGKGDKVHVVDNFLADDYTEFIIPDFLDRKIAEPMIGLTYNKPFFSWEVIYTPKISKNRYAQSGVWTPRKLEKLSNSIEGIFSQNIAAKAKIYSKAEADYIADPTNMTKFKAYTAALSEYTDYQAKVLSVQSNPDLLYPELYSLKYGQAGTRITSSIKGFDWGISYYYGRIKSPSVDFSKYFEQTQAIQNEAAFLSAYTVPIQTGVITAEDAIKTYAIQNGRILSTPEFEYDKLHVFGFECAAVLFKVLNTRFEFAYNMTEDFSGTSPWIHNHSISWLPGFDINLPVSNININIQNRGTFVLGGDKIKENKKTYKELDVDNDSKDCFTKNHLIVNISDTYINEKLKVEISALWGIERGDIVLQPKIRWTIRPDFDITGSGMWIWCNNADSEFYEWKDNSFIQLGMSFKF